MAKKVSMDFIAKKLDISKNTVSLALRNMPGISEQTRNLIFDTCRQYGYEYKKNSSDRMKTAYSSNTSRNICLIQSKDTLSSVGFFSIIQYSIESEAKKNRLNTILYCYDENNDEFETPLCIKEGIISGIITLGRISKKTLNAIFQFGLPTIIIDHYFDDFNANYVLCDNVSGGFIATEYLIKSGHRDIGFFGEIDLSPSFFDRYLGYLKAMRQYNIKINDSFSIVRKSFADSIEDCVDLAVAELKQLPKLPTAMFCCNDNEAISVIKGLNQLGISVPQEVSVIGFDNIDSSQNMVPELTTMHIPKESMGEKAIQKLVSIMEDSQENAPEKILVCASLIERKSVQ